MRRILVAGIIILVVLMAGGFVSGTEVPVPVVDSGPDNEVIPISLIPAGAADRAPADAGPDDNVPLSGTATGETVPAGTATAGFSGDRDASVAGVSETSARVGRYKTQTLTPYPITIGSGSHPAVISRYPGKVDMFYWNCADSNTVLCHVNTTAKIIGDTNPEYSWESSITPGFFHRYSPAVYSMNASHLGVFFVGWYDGSLYQVQWTQDAGWQPYTAFYNLGVNSTPAAVSRFDGNIELAYVNDTGYVIHRSYNSGVWSDGEVISYEGWFTDDGVSIVSTSPDSFDIFLRRASGTHQNTIERKHWNESGGWSPVGTSWWVTHIPAYSFVGASTRKYTDASVTTTMIDIVTNGTSGTHAAYYWNVSSDGGLTWHPEPYTNNGLIMFYGSPFVGVSPHYNRVEFYQEWESRVYEVAYRTPTYERTGIFRNGLWGLEKNGSFSWDAGDTTFNLGTTGDIPVTGDWNGNGIKETGIFRNGLWGLDYNGNGVWDAGDKAFSFGTTGDVPVVGDWNSSGHDKVGIFRNGLWGIDYNGNFTWDAGDKAFNLGTTGDKPVVGDWDMNGHDKVGIFRNGLWGIDYNGNFAWDAGDKAFSLGTTGDKPVVGDWSGNGVTKVGIFRNGLWGLDYNGNFAWDAGDKAFNIGTTNDIPVIGNWNGTGGDKIGIFRNGLWGLDYNGNFAWDGADKAFNLGQTGDVPIVGGWI